MPRKARLETITPSARLRNRALWCRRLAEGAGDRVFAEKLYALSQEFEGRVKAVSWRNYPDRADS